MGVVCALAGIASAAESLSPTFAEGEECDDDDADAICTGVRNGLTYRYSRDGTSALRWVGFVAKERGQDPDDISLATTPAVEVVCTKNPVDDSKLCTLLNLNSDRDSKFKVNKVVFSLSYEGDRGRIVPCIGLKHYPDAAIRIRFDEGEPFSDRPRSGGCLQPDVGQALLKAKTVVTEYQEWPRRVPIVAFGDTVGIPEALDLADFLLGRL